MKSDDVSCQLKFREGDESEDFVGCRGDFLEYGGEVFGQDSGAVGFTFRSKRGNLVVYGV